MSTASELTDSEAVKQYWAKLVGSQRPIVALGCGVAIAAVLLMLLTVVIRVSFGLWCALLVVSAVALGKSIRRVSRAVTTRYGFLAAGLTLLCGFVSALIAGCQGVPTASAIVLCLAGISSLSFVLAAVCVVSAVIAFFCGYYRFSAAEILKFART